MLEWLTELTAAELSEQAAVYAMRSRDAAGASTREAFDRLARECSGLAAKREAEKNVADAASTRLIPAVRISRVAGSVSWRSGAATHPRQPSPSAGPSPDSAHAPGPGD
jgi:hypothetical protein